MKYISQRIKTHLFNRTYLSRIINTRTHALNVRVHTHASQITRHDYYNVVSHSLVYEMTTTTKPIIFLVSLYAAASVARSANINTPSRRVHQTRNSSALSISSDQDITSSPFVFGFFTLSPSLSLSLSTSAAFIIRLSRTRLRVGIYTHTHTYTTRADIELPRHRTRPSFVLHHL